CNEHEVFNLVDMGSEWIFSGKATCENYEKIFQFNPDLNAKKGHMLKVSEISGNDHLSFHVSEFTLDENGTITRTIDRPGDIVTDNTWFAPTTGIIIRFTRGGGTQNDDYDYSFTATITNTPTNHHCPFPFIDLQPDAPLVLEDTLIEYYCDAMITAPPGYDVRIDHIKNDNEKHELNIKILDDEKELLEEWTSFPVQDWLPGANAIILIVNWKDKSSHHFEIKVSAVKLNCTCGPTEYVFDSSLIPHDFQSPDYPKAHCRMISCQTTFTLPSELRQKYKIRMSSFEKMSHGTVEIDEGANGITTINEEMKMSFTFESPSVTLTYLPEGKRYGDVFNIQIELVERQEGCACPSQNSIATDFRMEIPAYCKQLDCLYELPQFDDNTVEYFTAMDTGNEYVGSRRTGMTADRFSYESGEGTYEFDDWTNRAEGMIIRYHRENPTNNNFDFRFHYTTSGHHISHAERCGCSNQTIALDSNQTMQITSPDFPHHYCNNLVCVTTFVAPVHHHLELKVN
ncbi:hypothetical protein PENTCL1PPCAC_30640, partial [Pristionchus entomophagus]